MSVRRATPDDAAELTRLRGVMYESWREPQPGEEWRRSAEAMFARRLRDEPETFVAFVVDHPHGGLAASGVGWISEHLPNSFNLDGRRGHIASMSTVPDARRAGHARRIIEALVQWFDARGITRIDLVATAMGEPLYRSVGFTDYGDAVALVRRAEERPTRP